jgi:hypothetical protein
MQIITFELASTTAVGASVSRSRADSRGTAESPSPCLVWPRVDAFWILSRRYPSLLSSIGACSLGGLGFAFVFAVGVAGSSGLGGRPRFLGAGAGAELGLLLCGLCKLQGGLRPLHGLQLVLVYLPNPDLVRVIPEPPVFVYLKASPLPPAPLGSG